MGGGPYIMNLDDFHSKLTVKTKAKLALKCP
jgi:hypothetical protein